MIPVHNLYFMLMYAWDALDQAEAVDVEPLDQNSILELLGGVMAAGVSNLLRRGLDRGYVENSETIPGIRGRLDVDTSLRRVLLPQALAHCRFDELSRDVQHNRIIKATLKKLTVADQINGNLRRELASLYQRFGGVSDENVSAHSFNGIQLKRKNGGYRLLLQICRLVHDEMLMDESTGRACFRDFQRDKGKMRKLFERFVRTFWERHNTDYKVTSPRFGWHGQDGSSEALAHLPEMRTDIVLRSKDRCIVVDTKFAGRTLTLNEFGQKKVKTGHLFQLHAYMSNMVESGRYPADLEGMLLYPETDCPVDLQYLIQGRRVRVVTVNMNQPWKGIHRDLRALVA